MERFYDPNQGHIARQCGHKDVAIKMVTRPDRFSEPRACTLATTILENILYGKPDATTTEVEAAVLAANAHSFITLLPNGCNSNNNNNKNTQI
ncbi:putative ABC-type xenobiotic transporter [Helianthus anomalus]